MEDFFGYQREETAENMPAPMNVYPTPETKKNEIQQLIIWLFACVATSKQTEGTLCQKLLKLLIRITVFARSDTTATINITAWFCVAIIYTIREQAINQKQH